MVLVFNKTIFWAHVKYIYNNKIDTLDRLRDAVKKKTMAIVIMSPNMTFFFF